MACSRYSACPRVHGIVRAQHWLRHRALNSSSRLSSRPSTDLPPGSAWLMPPLRPWHRLGVAHPCYMVCHAIWKALTVDVLGSSGWTSTSASLLDSSRRSPLEWMTVVWCSQGHRHRDCDASWEEPPGLLGPGSWLRSKGCWRTCLCCSYLAWMSSICLFSWAWDLSAFVGEVDAFEVDTIAEGQVPGGLKVRGLEFTSNVQEVTAEEDTCCSSRNRKQTLLGRMLAPHPAAGSPGPCLESP